MIGWLNVCHVFGCYTLWIPQYAPCFVQTRRGPIHHHIDTPDYIIHDLIWNSEGNEINVIFLSYYQIVWRGQYQDGSQSKAKCHRRWLFIPIMYVCWVLNIKNLNVVKCINAVICPVRFRQGEGFHVTRHHDTVPWINVCGFDSTNWKQVIICFDLERKLKS